MGKLQGLTFFLDNEEQPVDNLSRKKYLTAVGIEK